MYTREEVRIALDHNFKSLMDCLGQLTEEELTAKPVTGDWTAKDVIAHVWDWGDETLRTARAWLTRRPWQDGVTYDDAWSESRVVARRTLPLISVVDGMTGVHRRLMTFLDLAEDATLVQVNHAPWGVDIPLIDLFHEMAQHYAEHAQVLATFQLNCLGEDQGRTSPC